MLLQVAAAEAHQALGTQVPADRSWSVTLIHWPSSKSVPPASGRDVGNTTPLERHHLGAPHGGRRHDIRNAGSNMARLAAV
jgi:hypothetical protein